MIQDISPHVFHNEFYIKDINQDDFLLLFTRQKQVLLKEVDGTLALFTLREFRNYVSIPFDEDPEFLLSIDNKSFFMADYTEEMAAFLEQSTSSLPYKLKLYPISTFRTFQPSYYGFAGITAHHIYSFRKSRAFCGCCGTKMVKSQTERAMVCPNCKNVEYPKICPAVTVAIMHDDKLLMARNVLSNRFALIAGFVEIGETFEDTVKREVMEEVGLRVKNIRYYKSQPWAFSETAMIGFFVELDGENEYIKLDTSELSKAKWFTREEIPDYPTTSLTFEMVSLFKQNKVPPYYGKQSVLSD